MRLREDTSRNRGTMGITWLVLLSLGFLFHCVTSAKLLTTTKPTSTTTLMSETPTPTKKPTTSTNQPTTSTNQPTTSTNQSTTSTNQPTTSTNQSTTSTNQPTTSTNQSTTSTNKPTTQPQATSATNSPLKIHSNISAAPSSVIPPETRPTNTTPVIMNPAVVAQVHTNEPTVATTNSKSEETSKDSKPTQPSYTTEHPIKPNITTNHKHSAVENTSKTLTPLMTTKANEPNGKPGPGADSTTSALTTTTSRPTTAKTWITTTLASAATATATTTTTIPSESPLKKFHYSLNSKPENEEDKVFVKVCKQLMANLQDGRCNLTWRHHNSKVQLELVEIDGKVKPILANQYYEELTKKATDSKTLIAILASCGALLIMIVILAVCASHHRKPYNETQQHLTEELHTVENGYHDNPTLEVMEVQPEMQEKKVALNGEFNDSWIVPIDNLLKEDVPDEEDTHL